MRIGLAMGEVVVADGTVTGDGIVLAQRLEQLAEAGGVCIQDAVKQVVPRRLPIVHDDRGEQVLQGFADPVRLFAIRSASETSKPGHRRSNTRRRRASLTTVAIALAAAAGALAWWQPWKTGEPTGADAARALPLPDRPSLAVQPFTNVSGDPEQDYFADGMTDDLITDLSRVSGLFVIARNSVFAYKGEAVDVRRVSRELGVRHVLEGSVRRSGDEVRINAQLIDASTGGTLWAERSTATTPTSSRCRTRWSARSRSSPRSRSS